MDESTAKARALVRSQISRAESLPLHMLECRVGGTRHRWRRVRPLFTYDAGLTEAFQCERCLCVKHSAVSPKYGEQLRKPTYIYPAGYSLKRPDNGELSMSPAAVRATLVRMVDWEHLPEITPLPIPEEEP